jgi:hypothetical protein
VVRVADVLFVTSDGGGNVPPALGLAAELRRRGHDVRFLGHAQQRPVFEAAGFPFRPYSRARPWSSTAPVDGLAGALTVFRMFADRGPGLDLLDEARLGARLRSQDGAARAADEVEAVLT